LAINFYLDESGDLGWKLNKPYRQGGSSRFLTISTLTIHESIKFESKRVIRKLHKKFKILAKYEIKWSQLKHKQRLVFAQMAKGLIIKEPNDIKYFSIVVKKENVMDNNTSNEMFEVYQLDRVNKKMLYTKTRVGTKTITPLLSDSASLFVGNAKKLND